MLFFGAATTLYHYFVVWPTLAERSSDHPLYMAHYLTRQQDQFTLVPLTFYSETVTHFLLQEKYPHLENLSSTSWEGLLNSGRFGVYLLPYQEQAADRFALLVPAKAGPGRAYLLPPLSSGQVEKLAAASETTVPLEPILDSEQELIARVYPLAAEAPLAAIVTEILQTNPSEFQSVEAEFDQTIRLVSYQLDPPLIKPGDTLTLTLTWQARRPVDGDYNLFIHLFEVGQPQRYSQVNLPLTGILFEAHRWPVGLHVPDIYRFTLPAEAPAGLYRFEVGLYHAASQQRLPVRFPSTNSASVEDDKIILGTLRVRQYPPSPPKIPLVGVHFGGAITLTGVDLPQAPVAAGQAITYTLHWQATADISQNFTVFTHLLDGEGKLRAQQDNNIPQQGRYPTSWWKTGDQVLDPYTLTLPPDLEPGPYTLRIGWYYPETGRRLRLQNSKQDFVDLPASITIQP